MKETIELVRDGWPAYLALGRTDKTQDVYKLCDKTLPDQLKAASTDPSYLKFLGSTGKGMITAAPWVAAIDTRITSSVQEGFYVVYLFSLDMEGLFLSLGLGATQFKQAYGDNRSALKPLHAASTTMRENYEALANDLLNGSDNSSKQFGRINLTDDVFKKLHSFYEVGSIFSLRYDLRALPNDSALVEDWNRMLRLYRDIIEDPMCPDTEQLLGSALEKGEPSADANPFIEFAPRPPKTKRGKKGTGTSRPPGGKKNLRIGRKGEAFVERVEKKRLIRCGLPDKAEEVDNLAARNETPGWDITSFNDDGSKRFIEVKTTVQKKVSSVILTRKEWKAACEPRRKKNYFVYVVTDIHRNPKIEVIRDPECLTDEELACVEPYSYEVYLGPKK